MRTVLLLLSTRLLLPLLFVCLMTLAIQHPTYGLALVLLTMCGAGYLTGLHVDRRANRGIAGSFVAEHPITLDDGTASDTLERENAVKPAPARLLGYRYAAGWSSRPEAVVRIAPEMLRAIGIDILGLTLGMTAILLVVVCLAAAGQVSVP